MSITARFGHVRAQSTFIEAAIVAAHGAHAHLGGFRASDVRFFFLLFTNWIEHDVLRPEQDLELTQVRRVLSRLLDKGWLVTTSPSRGAGRRHALSDEGLVGLAESVAEGRGRRPFEEALFVVCFLASYRELLLARARDATTPAARKRLATLLDARRALRSVRRTWHDLVDDLETRIAGSRRLEEEARKALSLRAGKAETAKRLSQAGSYQLERIRPITELLGALPDDLLSFELEAGIARRTALLFEPLAERARAERAILDRLEAVLPVPAGE